MDVANLPLDQLDVISAKAYAEHGYPHEAWTRLRHEDPVHWSHPPGYRPFWAITKHADITEVSTQPDVFRSFGRFVLFPEEAALGGPSLEDAPPLRMLVNMDPPEHRDYRRLVSGWFTPRAVARLEERLEVITRGIFDDLAKDGRTYDCDFVRDVAALQPLRMITEILGIPREHEDFVLRVTNENFGVEDPDFQRAGTTQEERLGFLQEAFAFLARITADRRAQPRDDLSTVLANAVLPGGQLVPDFELFSLYFLVMVAGHDTTRNAISSGMLALLEHPDELARLRRNPALIETGADEIVRWTTPVNHFVRTATTDYVLRGKQIRRGDSLALFYASANRDEEVFADPFVFRLDRDPNPHLGFGVGEHFCLGAHLARLDLKVFFRQLAERMESLELAGPVELLHASFVGGPKRMPIRYRLKAAA
jgi:cytochrome P450